MVVPKRRRTTDVHDVPHKRSKHIAHIDSSPADGDASIASNNTEAVTNSTNLVDLTTHNSTTSPLLRLPAELRSKIWRYAYGDLEITVRENYYHRLTYEVKSNSNLEDKSTPMRILPPLRILPQRYCVSLPLVSKQFWHEASASFFSTSIFAFQSYKAFCCAQRKPWIPRIENLRIWTFNCSDLRLWETYYRFFWDKAVQKFTGLKGLELVLRVQEDESRFFEVGRGVMRSRAWKHVGLHKLVYAFQRLQLVEARTKVQFVPHPSHGEEMRRRMADTEDSIRKLLLDHGSRRRSGRKQQK